MKKASIIISFYNKIDYLRLVLAGFERQSFRDFEVVIADDGSVQSVVSEIEKISRNHTFEILHVWQEDKGFRKNRILNSAIEVSSSNYLIFIDGDCVPHKNFVNEHLTYKDDGYCLTGRRVNLSKKITKKITPINIQEEYLENHLSQLIFDGIFGKSFDVEKGFYFKSELLRNYFNKKQRGLLGCNFSVYKKDMLNINGFDERYEAPSIGEDSDIQFRLELNGLKVKSLNNIAVQFHLYHQIQPRPQENLDLFEKIKKEKRAFTNFGIKQSF
jgi:glycosyltransferase involved in cell wall biosynthesis